MIEGVAVEEARASLRRVLDEQRTRLASWPTPVERLQRIERALGFLGALYVKRDDAACFAFGGSKVREFEILLAEAQAANADTLVGIGTTHSNCARITAAVAAKNGYRCSLVLSGPRPARSSGNLLLCELLGAEIEYVASNADRPAARNDVLERLLRAGRRPFEIPLSAATARSALTMTEAVFEVLAQGVLPDVIIVCSSSGATQAGLVLGCALAGMPTRVIGVSPDDPAAEIRERVGTWLDAMLPLLGLSARMYPRFDITVDDTFASMSPLAHIEGAVRLFAATEGVLVDPMYTGKTAAALVRSIEERRLRSETVLFWHTGGEISLFEDPDSRAMSQGGTP
jgi:D-cysteine desulfhydrase